MFLKSNFIRFSDNLKNKTHYLFDDMVTDCKVSFENIKIEIINIKKYKG
jgi:hypothetical protein